MKYRALNDVGKIEVSLPSWERGLKFQCIRVSNGSGLSLPSWERGLKSRTLSPLRTVCLVAPFVGAWIEIYLRLLASICGFGRSLRGSVD